MSTYTHNVHRSEHVTRRWRQLISDHALEIIMGFLLAVAGVATSWSSYQAALWDGEQAALYTQTGAARSESVRASTEAGQYALADVVMLTEWLDATAAGDTRRADFYRARFRPEFVPAFDAWMASRPLENPDAKRSPFLQPEYQSALRDLAAAKGKEADEHFKEGQKANANSDYYVRVTVLFAMALFFIGVAQQFKFHTVRMALAGFAALMLILGLYEMHSYPILAPG